MMDKWINNNTVAKVLALIVSILLWVLVHMDNNAMPSQTASTTMGTSVINNVQVQAFGFDEDKYVLKSIEPSTVNIEIRGQSELISYFSTDNYKAKVDLSEISGPGTVTLPVSAETPASVQYVSSSPSAVRVTIEEKTSNAFTPQIQVKGQPADGYQQGDAVITDETDKVNVTLPQSRLQDVQSVRGVIDITGANSTVSKTVTLSVYDKNGNVIDGAVLSPSSVKVEVPIGAAARTLPLNLSYTGQLPDNLVLANTEVSTDEITVYGSEAELAALGDTVTASINLSSIEQAGTVTLTAALDLPEGTERISPSSVQVRITTEEFSEREIQNVPVTLSGTANNTEAVISQPKNQRISVNVKGAPGAIESVKPEDITATVNLNNRGPGTYKLPVQIVLPETVSLSNPGTETTVTVTVTAVTDSQENVSPEDNSNGNAAGEEGEAAGTQPESNSSAPSENNPGSTETNENEGDPSGGAADNPAESPGEGTDSGASSGTSGESNTESNSTAAPPQGKNVSLDPVPVRPVVSGSTYH